MKEFNVQKTGQILYLTHDVTLADDPVAELAPGLVGPGLRVRVVITTDTTLPVILLGLN